MPDEWTGQEIDGRYVVESVLGRGGMGIVLRARHRFTGAEVAIKMLHTALSGDARMQERFLTECRAAAAIGHPAIVQVSDAGRTPEGELYLVMELLAGRSLRAALPPRPPPEEVRRIGLALLDALGAAHARGIVHRDLKPENVFLAEPAGTVKLLDFGVAKSLTGTSSYTAQGSVLGTVSYMAPEQLADASTVDGRADLWAVGVMLYELLAGTLPYRAANLGEMMSALALSEPVPIGVHLPGAHPSVQAFFARSLARDRSQRFASAHEMARALAAAALETAVPPPRTMGGMPTTASGETDPQRRGVRAPVLAQPGAPGAPAVAPIRPVLPAIVSVGGATGSSHPPPRPPEVRPIAPCARPTALARPQERRWLALVIGAVAIVSIIVGVIAIATSGRAGYADAAVAPERRTDRDAPTPPPAALPTPIDPPTAPAFAPPAAATSGSSRAHVSSSSAASTASTASSASRSPTELCQAACASGCGLEGPDCVRICLATRDAAACLASTGTADCPAWSRCVLGASCSGTPPRGDASCRETYACERACRDNIACSCSCLGRMSPVHALALTRLSTCALFVCANESTCVRDRCRAERDTCDAS
jgi:serine/threonine-protein kinase